jgi:hypothetical protein
MIQQENVKRPERTRYQQGLAKLAQVDGKAGEEVVSRLGDLGRYIVEFSFGDIYSREGLSLRDRQIATVAMLTVLSPPLLATYRRCRESGIMVWWMRCVSKTLVF